MIRLEKAGREDLAALVQLQEMVRARLLPEGQPLPETAGDSLEDFFAHGVVLRALMEDDTMVGAVGGREVDGGQHLAQLLVHPQWQGQYVETMLLLQMESLLPEARANCCSRHGMPRICGPCCGWAIPSVKRRPCRTA